MFSQTLVLVYDEKMLIFVPISDEKSRFLSKKIAFFIKFPNLK